MALQQDDRPQAGGSPARVIVDTDAGIDDAIALLFAFAHPALDVVAITSVVGNVEVDQATTNVCALIELAGPAEAIVASGSARPLRAAHKVTGYHGVRGFGHAHLPESSRTVDPHGVELLVRLAREHPGELTLLALGPLTNVAAAVLAEPHLPTLLGPVVIMGGAYDAPGNVTPRSEFNIAVDPEAAQIVVRAWEQEAGAPPLTLVGLDVTRRALLRPTDVAAIIRAAGLNCPPNLASTLSGTVDDPVAQFLIDSLRHASEGNQAWEGPYAADLHDALAAVALVDKRVLVTRPATVDVETVGELTRGETVADWGGSWGRRHNANVAVDLDVDRFRDLLIEALATLVSRSGLAHSDEASPRPRERCCRVQPEPGGRRRDR